MEDDLYRSCMIPTTRRFGVSLVYSKESDFWRAAAGLMH